MRVAFSVKGHPVPQGSMRAVPGTDKVRHNQGAALAMWRADIRYAAERAYDDAYVAGPITMVLTFRFKRPKAHYRMNPQGQLFIRPNYEHSLPIGPPDLDKLIRGVLDALTGTLYHDDAQVTQVHARKVYAHTEGMDALVSWQEEDAAWVGADEGAGSGEGQLPMPLVWGGDTPSG